MIEWFGGSSVEEEEEIQRRRLRSTILRRVGRLERCALRKCHARQVEDIPGGCVV